VKNIRKELLKEAKRLIRLKSVTTESNKAIALHVGKLLKEAGFHVRYQAEKIKGVSFYNVVGQKGKGKHPLIFMTHLDTVPPGPYERWTKTGGDPWNPVIQGDRIYGLGSADTKLDILPKIFASREVPEKLMKRPIVLVGTFGEERGLLGARFFCSRLREKGGIALVSEPSELRWVHEHRGYLVLEVSIPTAPYAGRPLEKMYGVEVKGKAVHSSIPKEGRNAIRIAFDFLDDLSRRNPDLKLLFSAGGSSPNQVPASASFIFATTEKKISSRPFIKVSPFKSIGQSGYEIPRKALSDLFDSVDEGIRKWPRKMTSNVGLIRVEKGWVKFCVDFRVHPKDTNQKVLLLFQKRIKKVLERHRLYGRFRVERDGPSLSLPPKSSIIHLARSVSRRLGVPFRLIRKPSCTEAGFLREKGIPAVVFGAGKSGKNIHAPNEYNELSQLEKAFSIYRSLIEAYCCR